jgi:potassium/hydrogen antiporter
VNEIQGFGQALLLGGAALAAALVAAGFTGRLHLPTPVVFLAIGYGVGVAVSQAGDIFGPVETSRVGTVGLVVILFAGGLDLGLHGLMAQGRGVALLGLLGTAATAVALAATAHLVTDLGWTASFILGAILSPTDPAAVFSLLRGRDVSRRASSILQGEAGINDPVAIVLTIAMLESLDGGVTVPGILGEMAVEAGIAAAVALAAVVLLRPLLRAGGGAFSPPVLPLVLGAFAFAAYGGAAVLGGSGFLAVYLLGLALGDERISGMAELKQTHETFAQVAEAGLFLVLGIALSTLSLRPELGAGLAIAAGLVLVIRPLVGGVLLAAEPLNRDERLVVILGGLKGAVPLVLGTLPFIYGMPSAARLFALAAVASVASVVVQGVAVSLLIAVRSDERMPKLPR